MTTQPSDPTRDLAALAVMVRDTSDTVTTAVERLDEIVRWRRRFAIAVAIGALIVVTFAVIAGIAIKGNSDSNEHINRIVTCSNDRFRGFVNAVATRAKLSTQQSNALTGLLSQVQHAQTSKQFTDEINAYISAVNTLAHTPVPVYPPTSCT